MRFKALVIDVDRTLITSKHALPSKKVKEAIIKAKRKGNIHISLATARPFIQIQHLCEELELSGLCVVSGGARIVDVYTGKFYREHCLSYKKLQQVYQIVKNFEEPLNFWVQDNGADYTLNDSYIPYKPLVIVINNITPKTSKILLEKLSCVSGIFVTKTKSHNKGFIDINITHKRATKHNGITTIARMLGIAKHEIVAVGDGYNDHSLFLASGVKVAMGNAVDEIKQIADYTAPSVDDDGLAHVIERYFLNPTQQ